VNSLLRPRFLPLVVLLCVFGSLCAWCASASDEPPSNTLKATSDTSEISIPGPLRSFLRMAGISQKISREDVLPLLARNVYMQGYEG